MRILLLCLIFVAVLVAQGPAEKQLAAAHEAFLAAARSGDVASLEKLFSSQLQYSHSNAKLENKAEALAAIAQGKPDFKLHEQNIQIFGNVGIIRAKITAVKSNLLLSVLTVWVSRGGQWQMVQRQTTRIVPE